uniref:VWFD domain-containing protein n=1 Tax=Naja naja TaxID=35670 RepID=A0A8C7DWI2_NAJNA
VQSSEQFPYVVVDGPLGFRVKFDGDQQLLIQVDERYKGHLCGLCGTYSGSQLDDFQQPDGMLVTDTNKFGNSWRVEDDDWRQVTVNKVFSGVNHIFRFEQRCRVILSSNGQCHAVVDPTHFLENCIYDVCLTQGQQTSMCHGIQAYAASCANAGLCVEWRNTTLCRKCWEPWQGGSEEIWDRWISIPRIPQMEKLCKVGWGILGVGSPPDLKLPRLETPALDDGHNTSMGNKQEF